MSTRVLAVVFLFVGALAGCEACGAERHARAQGLDAGLATPSAPLSAAAPALCFVEASERAGLLDVQTVQLCQGAPTPRGPIDCFLRARQRLALTDPQLILLCRCSPSVEPVDCYELLDLETFLTDVQMLELCSPTLVRGLLASCVQRTL